MSRNIFELSIKAAQHLTRPLVVAAAAGADAVTSVAAAIIHVLVKKINEIFKSDAKAVGCWWFGGWRLAVAGRCALACECWRPITKHYECKRLQQETTARGVGKAVMLPPIHRAKQIRKKRH